MKSSFNLPFHPFHIRDVLEDGFSGLSFKGAYGCRVDAVLKGGGKGSVEALGSAFASSSPSGLGTGLASVTPVGTWQPVHFTTQLISQNVFSCPAA